MANSQKPDAPKAAKVDTVHEFFGSTFTNLARLPRARYANSGSSLLLVLGVLIGLSPFVYDHYQQQNLIGKKALKSADAREIKKKSKNLKALKHKTKKRITKKSKARKRLKVAQRKKLSSSVAKKKLKNNRSLAAKKLMQKKMKMKRLKARKRLAH